MKTPAIHMDCGDAGMCIDSDMERGKMIIYTQIHTAMENQRSISEVQRRNCE